MPVIERHWFKSLAHLLQFEPYLSSEDKDHQSQFDTPKKSTTIIEEDSVDEPWHQQESESDHNIANSKRESQEVIIVWKNVILMSILHGGALFGCLNWLINGSYLTAFWATFLGVMSGIGVTAGAHRLWSHKAYKAKLPLRIFLAILQTIAGQNCIYEWCRDHRVHHRFSETDADPHNANRGFFFSHVGWLLCKKHPSVIERGKTVNCEDLLQDPVVYYQKKFYMPLIFVFNLALPMAVPMYFWNDTWVGALTIAVFARYCISLHGTWLVNSAAHLWGERPYNPNIGARENLGVAFFALGEGFHNFHHTYPYHYSTSEFGWLFNATTIFIDTMAKLGLAYDLRVAKVRRNIVPKENTTKDE